MKKLLCLMLSLVMLFTLFACGNRGEEIENDVTENNEEVLSDENVSGEDAPADDETQAEDEAPVEEEKEEESEPEKKPVSGTPSAPSTQTPENKPATKPAEKPSTPPAVEEAPSAPPVEEEKPSSGDNKTTGDVMLGIFRANASKSIDEIANACLADPSIQFMSGTMPVEPGFFAEFGGDIAGFDKGVKFGPMMGSIAFSGFVFEVSGDANAFAKELREKADPRWNICVEADQTVCEVSGNKVFFLMCPKSLEG